MADNKNREFSDSELDKLLQEYDSQFGSSSDEKKDSESGEQKKFVVNIDESLIDELDIGDSSSASPRSSGGVYFSSYQQKGRRQTESGTAPVTTRSSGRAVPPVKHQKKKVKKSFGGGIAAGYLAFIIIATVVLSYIGLTCVGDMLAINRNETPVNVDIPEGSSYSEIINILDKNGLIKRKQFCKIFTKYRGFDEENYLSGSYTLSRNMGVEGMLMHVMEAPVSAESVTVSIPEGWTAAQIFERLQKNEVCDVVRLYASGKNSATYSSFDFIMDIAGNEGRYLILEGYLFPDTYEFYVDADPNYVFKKFLENFDEKWEDEFDTRAAKLGYTRDEIITIASIIQKEAADASQMKIVSSVIHNRLKDPANYPALNCDSTTLYVSNYVTPTVGAVQGDKYLEYYNTDTVRGLPPGPICNPGIDAIKAALYPEESNYYYFAHDNSQEIYLAETLSEHKNNLVKIIKANNGD